MVTQIRRYELHPEHEAGFVEWWKAIPEMRKKYGFTVLSAYLDPVRHEFTWIVRHDGDLAAFEAAEKAWGTAPERVVLFEGQPQHTSAIHVSLVDTVL